MQLFYIEQPALSGAVFLSEEESFHCIKVLRHRQGDVLHLTDGVGNFYVGRLQQADSKKALVAIEETLPQPAPVYSVHLAVAPTKNMDRNEWLLEKAVELGVQQVSWLQCQHSERIHLKWERLQKIALSAIKQSLQAYLPVQQALVAFDKFLPTIPNHFQKRMAYIDQAPSPLLQHTLQPRQDVCVLIGPEGDFSPEEVALAKQLDFQLVSLGKNRLRTETAAVVACHTCHLINA
ncbi:MAG TPA: 16S rRNA (uracil(1498)-N(3))-methyltransferase [Microscillaceae bacterium]|nr:16S rRNA (uracil(1498)-N(3))-methyltransferase [Microscillaceae bacterium]